MNPIHSSSASARFTSRSARAGVSMIEAIVALTLGLFVVHMGLTAVVELRRAGVRLAARQDALLSLRIARHVLRRELGHSDAVRDWSVGGDSLSLRAFRGMGLLCEEPSSSTGWVVAYRGERAPDPAKDSLEVTYSDGSVRYADLIGVGAAAEACGTPDATEVTFVWRTEPPLGDGAVLARIFERGSYHVSGSALRYRRGGGGRQPLTPELWSDEASGWRLGGGRVALELVPRSPEAGRPWSGFIAWLVNP